MDAMQLQQMLAQQWDGRDFAAWCAAFCARKYNADFAREMTRSVGEYLTQFQSE